MKKLNIMDKIRIVKISVFGTTAQKVALMRQFKPVVVWTKDGYTKVYLTPEEVHYGLKEIKEIR